MTATKSLRNRSARRRNRQMVEIVQADNAWEELKRDRRTTVDDYGLACQLKVDHDEFGRHTNDRVYITPLSSGGYDLRVVHENPTDEPHLSSVLALVAEAEAWGTTVDALAERKDSTRKGLSGERAKRAKAAEKI